MESRQSVCATLSQFHYAYLVNEVEKNGIKRAVSNRMNGDFTGNAKKDVEAMQEIAKRNGLKL